MAVISVTPIVPAVMRYEHRVRNGLTPDWRTARDIAHRQNFIMANMRKNVLTVSRPFGSLPQSVMSSEEIWHFYFRSGIASETHGTLRLRADVIAAPATNSGVTDPKWRMVVTVSGGATTNGSYVHLSDEEGGTITLDRLSHQTASVNIDGNTEYECHFECEDGAIIYSACVYEVATPNLESTDTGVTDPNAFFDSADVTAAQHTKLSVDNGHNLWMINSTHLFSMVPNDNDITAYWTHTGTSWSGILPTATTTVNANSPGFHLGTKHHQPVHTSQTGFKVAVLGRHGTEGGGGEVRIQDSTGTLATVDSFPDTTFGWRTQTGFLDGSGVTKLDVHMRSNHASDALEIKSVCCFYYFDDTAAPRP